MESWLPFQPLLNRFKGGPDGRSVGGPRLDGLTGRGSGFRGGSVGRSGPAQNFRRAGVGRSENPSRNRSKLLGRVGRWGTLNVKSTSPRHVQGISHFHTRRTSKLSTGVFHERTCRCFALVDACPGRGLVKQSRGLSAMLDSPR